MSTSTKIICLNIWNGGRLMEDLSTFITTHVSTTDVFCLQEVEEPFRTISPLLEGYNELHVEKKIGTERFDQSLFIRSSIDIAESGELLKEEADVGLGQWATIVRGGDSLTLCNFHGMPRPGDKYDNPGRLGASQVLVDFGANNPRSIIMGDFNLRETTESVAIFKKNGFRNLIKEYGVETTRNHLVWDLYPQNPMMHSDYVFVGPLVNVKRFEVLPDIVSDHQPLLLEIE